MIFDEYMVYLVKGVGFMSELNKSVASDKLRKPNRKEPKQISFRVSEDEYEKLKQSAETLNMSVPNFVKSKAKGSRLVTPKFDKQSREQIVKDLSSISNNTNQIARILNTRYVDEEDLHRNFNALREEVNRLWQQLN